MSTSIEGKLIEQLLERAQAIIKDKAELGELVVMAAKLCLTWSKRIGKIMTLNGLTQTCCGVESVRIHTDSCESAKVDVLVTRKDILGFDLQLGYDAIKAHCQCHHHKSWNCVIPGGASICHTLHQSA